MKYYYQKPKQSTGVQVLTDLEAIELFSHLYFIWKESQKK
jgi:hypothetical protein